MTPAVDRSERLIVALDVTSLTLATNLVARVLPHAGLVKVGLELFSTVGPHGVAALNAPVMLDLKFHDIPETVGRAVRACLPLVPKMITVHAAGGERMIRAARRACEEAGATRPLLLAITLLTHLDRMDLRDISWTQLDREDLIHRLAVLAVNSGADGVVCAAADARELRSALGGTVKLVCPGVRGADKVKQDHAKTLSPRDAVLAGADYVVVGRPIRDADVPADAAAAVARELNLAGSGGTDA